MSPGVADFARGLADLRKSVRLTIDDVAMRAKLPKAAITLATDGKTLPSAEVVEAYVRACGGSQRDVERWLARRESLVPPRTETEPDKVTEVEPSPPAPAADPKPRRRINVQRWWPRRRGQRVALVVAVVLIAATVIFVATHADGDNNFVSALPSCTGPAQATLRIAASADKNVLLSKVAVDYGRHLSEGQCVDVVVDEQNSGTAMRELAKNWTSPNRPDVWSPASSLWLPVALERGTTLLPNTPTGHFMTSPLVIAMPEPMAKALHWPEDRSIGWKKLAELATDPKGWADYNPKWGRFWLGKTNPNLSSSGFNATVAAFFAKQSKSNDLTPADIEDKQAQEFVRDIENSVAHYGETTLDFLANLRRADNHDRDKDGRCTGAHDHALSYISAVTLEESSMLAYNDGWSTGTAGGTKLSKPCTRLVAIYPSEGTLYSDHPYIELNGMDTTKKAVSTDFLNYLRSDHVQAQFQDVGFRDRNGSTGHLVSKDHGALPEVHITLLGTPSGAVLDKMLSEWSTKLRKPANILLIIDTSGSMGTKVSGGTRLSRVQETVRPLLDGIADIDRVGLWRFSDVRENLLDVGPLTDQLAGKTRRQVLSELIVNLKADGRTALYNTVADAVRTSSQEPNAINAIVMLTDGKNELDGGLTLGDERSGLLKELQPNSDKTPVRVFTIAYGTEADECESKPNGERNCVLERISDVTGGTRYDSTDTRNIEKVLAAVFSNF